MVKCEDGGKVKLRIMNILRTSNCFNLGMQRVMVQGAYDIRQIVMRVVVMTKGVKAGYREKKLLEMMDDILSDFQWKQWCREELMNGRITEREFAEFRMQTAGVTVTVTVNPSAQDQLNMNHGTYGLTVRKLKGGP